MGMRPSAGWTEDFVGDRTGDDVRLDPEVALAPGRSDPMALLFVWCVRKSFFPLLWIGMMGAALTGQSDRVDLSRYTSFTEAFAALLSPLAGLVLAIAVRIAAAWMGFGLAYRITYFMRPLGGSDDASRITRFTDQLHLARALRSLRWTWPVRTEAARRLGAAGRRLMIADRALSFANGLLLVALFVLIGALAD